MVLFFCLTTLQNWQNCPAALTNHSGFLSIQLGFFRTSRGGANKCLKKNVSGEPRKVMSRVGPVDKCQKTAETRSGPGRIGNMQIEKDGACHPFKV